MVCILGSFKQPTFNVFIQTFAHLELSQSQWFRRRRWFLLHTKMFPYFASWLIFIRSSRSRNIQGRYFVKLVIMEFEWPRTFERSVVIAQFCRPNQPSVTKRRQIKAGRSSASHPIGQFVYGRLTRVSARTAVAAGLGGQDACPLMAQQAFPSVGPGRCIGPLIWHERS